MSKNRSVPANKSLPDCEEMFRKLFEQISDFIMVTDFEGKFLDVNESMCRRFGYTKSELLEMYSRDLIEKKNLEEVPMQFSGLAKGDELIRERRMVCKDGSIIEVEVNLRRIDDNRIFAIARDITERKRTRVLIEQSEANLRSIIDSTDVSYVLIDKNLKVITVNNVAKRDSKLIYGKSFEVGTNILDYIPESRKTIGKEVMMKVLSGEIMQEEREFKTADGSSIYINLKEYPIKNDRGEITGICISATDISKQKRIELGLKEAEAKFRNLVEKSPSGIYIIQDGKYAYVNPMLAETLGYTREEIVDNMSVIDLIQEDYQAIVLEKIRMRMEGEIESVNYEIKAKKKNGELIWGEVYGTVTSYNGKPAIIGTMLDITERKKSYEKIIAIEQTRKLIMDSALDAIVCSDIKGVITVWTPKAEDIFGWKEAEVLGKRLSDIIIPQQYREAYEKGMMKYLRTGVSNMVLNKRLEISGLNKVGKEFPVELSIVSFMQNDEQYFCGFVRDITEKKKYEDELKRSEEKYRLLFYSNPLPMWMISYPEMQIIDVNEAAIQHYGYSREEFISMPVKQLHPADEYERFDNLADMNWAGINKLGTWKHKKKNGEIIYVEVNTHGMIFEKNKIGLVYGNDVTDIIKAKIELQQMNKQFRKFSAYLQEAREDERKYIAREIHDELGQLLTGIKMDIFWLNKKITPEQKEIAGRVEKTIELTNRTIESVRKIATELRPGILDDLGLEEAIRWQVNEMRRKSKIVFHIEGNLNGKYFSTEISTAVFRILQESLTNIIRHSDAKNVKVELNASKGKLHLIITDDGVGIKNTVIKEGKSLGLMGMKERAVMVNGVLNISSIPGKGTIIDVTIPLKTKTEQATNEK